MASLTQAQLPEALVTKYIPEVMDNLPKESFWMNILARGKEQFVGDELKFRTKVQENPSGGFRSGTRLARPGRFSMKWATVGFKRATFSTSIDRIFMDLTKKSDPEAVVDALEMDLESLKKSGLRKLELSFLGDGTGVLAQVNGDHAAGSTTITVEDPEGRLFGGARYLERGAYLTLQPDVPGGQINLVVGKPNYASQNFAVDATATGGPLPFIPDHAKIVYGDPDGNSYNNEPNGGVKKLFSSDATYLGLDRDEYDAWAPTRIGAVGDDTPFNIPYIQQILDIPKDLTGDGDAGPDVLIGHSSIWRSYLAEEVLPKQQYVQVDGIYKAGFKRAAWISGDKILPIEQAYTTPYGDIVGIRSGTWRMWTIGDAGLKMIPGPGGNMLHEIPGFDEYFLYAAWAGNLGCREPCHNVRLRGMAINSRNLPR